MACRSIEPDVTALVDGELPAWRAWRARRHLRSCSECTASVAETERAVAAQHRLMASLLSSPAVPADEMFRKVRVRLAEDDGSPEAHRRLRPRLVLASAVGVVAVFLALRVMNPVWIALGIETPPEQLSERPELFLDYDMFEHLPVIENLDRVRDVDARSQQG